MVIASTGNVGIGTTTPDSSLVVQGTMSTFTTKGVANVRIGNNQGVHPTVLLDNGSDTFMLDNLSGTGLRFVYNAASVPMVINTSGNVGIGTTTPWRTLSVTGTVGFDGLTGATGAGSLCLDANKQVVYNSASDACLSSTRATKHDINPLVVDALAQVARAAARLIRLQRGDGRTRYGFIAEDTAAVDAHLATLQRKRHGHRHRRPLHPRHPRQCRERIRRIPSPASPSGS